MLICTNLEDLQEQTHTRHYELYRCCKLEEMGFTDVGPENKPVSAQETYEAKRHELHDLLDSVQEELFGASSAALQQTSRPETQQNRSVHVNAESLHPLKQR
ncbi:Septin-10 [Sciurus carolinensis]|uniref:Septin-10 n=1 Tax=Sciurus carolinensis TaxID=30640 RepID=A0AA41NGY7_SCICA|nr:Septin-10 [Sciurus carolinensis]